MQTRARARQGAANTSLVRPDAVASSQDCLDCPQAHCSCFRTAWKYIAQRGHLEGCHMVLNGRSVEDSQPQAEAKPINPTAREKAIPKIHIFAAIMTALSPIPQSHRSANSWRENCTKPTPTLPTASHTTLAFTCH